MQEQYDKMREDLKNKTVLGTSGNGLVTIVLDGEHHMREIKIKPECIDPNDIEGLQDLICAAYENALQQLEKDIPDMNNMMPSLPFSF